MRKSSKDEFTLKTYDREDFYDKMSSEQHLMFDSIQENIFTFCHRFFVCKGSGGRGGRFISREPYRS